MKRFNLGYFLGQSLHALWRNGIMTIASVVVLMSCLVLIGSFTSLVYNINRNLDAVGVMNEISVIVKYDADEATVTAIGDAIGKMDNVASVKFVSKADALASERERYEEYSYLFDELQNDNPLPDIYTVTYADNSGVQSLVFQLGQLEGVEKVKNRVDIAQDIENVKNGVSFIFAGFLVILFVVSVFIIINTIKITVETRSREIAAMRYVGATNGFMSAPFLLEGAFIGVISAVLAFFIQWYLYQYISNAISNSYKIISVVPFSELQQYTALGFLVIGVVAGVIGSAISLRKYMKV